jgi:hypothetical protein
MKKSISWSKDLEIIEYTPVQVPDYPKKIRKKFSYTYMVSLIKQVVGYNNDDDDDYHDTDKLFR